ncbi:MAG TPA: nucleoside-diphosphate sugar epimerase/dehydratase [Actinomycetota bacterium]|nr:nucleoside-diphosphate sugar epimerase/dehydratase [Actinomycetota bacterium]
MDRPLPGLAEPRGASLPDRLVQRLRRDIPLALLDAVVVTAAYTLPLVVRIDGQIPERFWLGLRGTLPLLIVLHLSANLLFGLYGQMWRYASVDEARRVVYAGMTGAAFVVGGWFAFGPYPLPRSVVAAGAVLSFIGFGALRFQSRLFAFHRHTAKDKGARERILVFGAGDAGAMVLRDLTAHPQLGLRALGMVDDDPRKRGFAIADVRVLGNRADIPRLVQRLDVTQVLFAVPSATGDLVSEVAAICEEAQVRMRVLPSVREIVGGVVTARDIRDLSIEDLLGRRQVEMDLDTVRGLLTHRRVLITGAGGSIGSEIARQVSAFEPATLDLLDNDETHLHDALASIGSIAPATPILADVRHRDRILEVVAERRPEVIFHTAAHKHVPVLETHPREAVLTNVLGTANVVEAAAEADVERLVLISTDKAINPRSVMGASKRLAEDIVRGFMPSGSGCAVRFGNVLGSRGSVIPTFLKQIQAGGPVTVTDPEMRRYFMSIPEAVQLVLQAAALSRGGDVLTLDMGEPISILDLARKVIRLSGRVPGRDIEIVLSGARPGEKLVEDVRDDGEDLLPSAHPSIFVTRPPRPDRVALRRTLHRLESLCASRGDAELVDLLQGSTQGAVAAGSRVATGGGST